MEFSGYSISRSAIHAEKGLLGVSFSGGSGLVKDLRTKNTLLSWNKRPNHHYPSLIKFSPNGEWLSRISGKNLTIQNVGNSNLTLEADYFQDHQYFEDEKTVALARYVFDEAFIEFWDLDSMTKTYSHKFTSDLPVSISLHPTLPILAYIYKIHQPQANRIVIWNYRTNRVIKKLDIGAYVNTISTAVFTPNGKYLIAEGIQQSIGYSYKKQSTATIWAIK